MADTAGGSPGLNKLARVLSGRMRDISEGNMNDIEPDFGTINKDGSLTTDMFPIPLPKGEYYLGRLVSGIKVSTSGNEEHSHEIALPKLNAGDRVLVIWVQNEAVVVDVITKS